MPPWDKYAAPAASPPSASAPAPEAGPWAAYGTGGEEKAPTPAAAAVMITVKNRKGKDVSFQVPDQADDATIRRLAARATGEPRFASAVVDRDHWEGPKAVPKPDDQSALSGFVAGALKPIDRAAEWLSNTSVGHALDKAGQAIGLPSTADANASHDEWRRNNTRTGYQTIGNIAGTLPLARIPGLGGTSAASLAASGAATGALLTDAHDVKGTLTDAAKGAAGAVLGGKALQSLGGLVGGVANKGAKLLNDAGVPLTLGQIGRAAGNLPGRIASGLEDRAAGLPLIGDIINAARDRGINGLNTTLGNRILENVGGKLPAGTAPGHATVDAVQSQLSSRYNQLVPSLTGKLDAQAAQDFTAARDLAQQASRGDQLTGVVNRVFGGRLNGQSPAGATLSGKQLKDAESELTRLYGKYKNAQGDEGVYGDAINMVRQGLRDMVERSNPAHASELQGLNTAWAQMRTLRDAIRAGSDQTKATGIVTPGAALRVTARKGFRDPLLEAATETLPSRVPDSGTAGRAALLLGAGAAGGAAMIDPREHPILAGGLATAAALNTRIGQRALGQVAFGSRPAVVAATGKALNRLSRYAPTLVAPMAVTGDR